MIAYGKTAAHGVSIMSYLAVVRPEQWMGARDIAKARKISLPLTKKILTILSKAGLIIGQSGPSGGYRISQPPAQIALLGIVILFEKVDEQMICPFGPGWCGKAMPCPLHDTLDQLNREHMTFLRETTLSVFIQGHKKDKGAFHE